jgi:hypothetical protein
LPIVWVPVPAPGSVAYFGHIDGVHAPPAFSIRLSPFKYATGWEIRWQPGWRLVGSCTALTLKEAQQIAERWLLTAYFNALGDTP